MRILLWVILTRLRFMETRRYALNYSHCYIRIFRLYSRSNSWTVMNKKGFVKPKLLLPRTTSYTLYLFALSSLLKREFVFFLISFFFLFLFFSFFFILWVSNDYWNSTVKRDERKFEILQIDQKVLIILNSLSDETKCVNILKWKSDGLR